MYIRSYPYIVITELITLTSNIYQYVTLYILSSLVYCILKYIGLTIIEYT